MRVWVSDAGLPRFARTRFLALLLLLGGLPTLSAGGVKGFLRQQPPPRLALQVVNASPDPKLDPDGVLVAALQEALVQRLGPHLAGPEAPADTAKLVVVLTGRSVPPPASPGLGLLSWHADPRMAAYSALGIAKAHLARTRQLGYDPAVFTVTVSLVKGKPDAFSVSCPLDPGEIIQCMEPLGAEAPLAKALSLEEARAIAKAVALFMTTTWEWPSKRVQP